MLHPTPAITRVNNHSLLPGFFRSVFPPSMTSKLLPLDHNLVLSHALDVRLSEQVLRCERFVAQMFG